MRAIVGGDFTPLRIAYFKFQTIQMPDGRALPISTVDSVALDSIYVEPSPKKKPTKPPKKPQKAPDPCGDTLGTPDGQIDSGDRSWRRPPARVSRNRVLLRLGRRAQEQEPESNRGDVHRTLRLPDIAVPLAPLLG